MLLAQVPLPPERCYCFVYLLYALLQHNFFLPLSTSIFNCQSLGQTTDGGGLRSGDQGLKTLAT